MPQAEEILADRWVLVEKIDEGAMGEIFAARHAVLGHPVAVKVLIPTVSRDKAAIDRFLREARIAAKLQHRNVVRVEDFGVAADGRPFLVMELLRGESLARRLARAPRVAHAEALEFVRQIAAAVDTAHAAGIVHRDLKPENVFLANENGAVVVKVLDFGVAKFTDMLANGAHATASNTLIGTPRYMSPEQARSSRELDGRSDVWSLGMITFEMLTGQHPFEGEAIAELLVAILTHRIPPPTSLRAELPTALDVWAKRALARSRHDRFSTGRELADALADALDGRLDERWAGDAYELPSRVDSLRRGTLRVQRPVALPEADEGDESEPAVAEAAGPVTVSKQPDELALPGPEPGVTAPTSPRASGSRASWLLAAVVAAVAGLGLMAALRGTSASRNVGHPMEQHIVTVSAQEPERPPLPDVLPTVAEHSTLAVASPRDASSGNALLSAPSTTGRRRISLSPRTQRAVPPDVRAHAQPPVGAPNQNGSGGRLYDPTGI